MTVEVDEDEVSLDSVVRLAIPADTRFLRIARLTAAALASDLGFSLDDIEDLRIAVDEACAAIIGDVDPGAGSTLELVYLPAADGRSVTIEGHCAGAGSAGITAITMHPVAAELLDLTTTSHAIWAHENGRSFRFDKVVDGSGAGS